MFKSKKFWYISLFAILYLIVAFSSFWHAIAFFGLANNAWMSIILAFAFEIGQAAVLFSLLTSSKDRRRFMPWVLMTVFTLVQVIGNVFSSYKFLITNSVENLRFFKEPIFIWTDLPDDQTTVIITYIVGAILPICSLLLTSMITNYLTDIEEEKQPEVNVQEDINTLPEPINQGPSEPIELHNEKEFIDTYNQDEEQKQEENKLSETSEESTEHQNNTKIEKDNEKLNNNKYKESDSKKSHFVNL